MLNKSRAFVLAANPLTGINPERTSHARMRRTGQEVTRIARNRYLWRDFDNDRHVVNLNRDNRYAIITANGATRQPMRGGMKVVLDR